ncbi:MAG: hypothetical protein II942_05260 [Alphaproteobacteria bacterium]|nr:hypothetical protein [Alphaproteobacteria bacterium]
MYDNIEFIIAAAGECTRNFPHSKAIAHKSLLPMGDMRIIDYTLQDIVRIGGRHITFVCSNQAVIDDFKRALATDTATEQKLRKKGKNDIADVLKNTFLPDDIDLKFVIQDEPLGTGDVIYSAQKTIQNRHAVLIFPDDLIISKDPKCPYMKKLLDAFFVNPKVTLMTGIIKEDVSNNAILVNNRVVEKPKKATSHVAGYSPVVLPSEVVKFLIGQADIKIKEAKQQHKEWLYMDSLNDFLDQGGETAGFGVEMFLKPDEDQMLDTGNLALYEQCQLEMLLKHSVYKDENKAFIKQLLNNK